MEIPHEKKEELLKFLKCEWLSHITRTGKRLQFANLKMAIYNRLYLIFPWIARWLSIVIHSLCMFYHSWLVVWTPLKNISQLGWLATQYFWENKKWQPNHQPVVCFTTGYLVLLNHSAPTHFTRPRLWSLIALKAKDEEHVVIPGPGRTENLQFSNERWDFHVDFVHKSIDFVIDDSILSFNVIYHHASLLLSYLRRFISGAFCFSSYCGLR